MMTTDKAEATNDQTDFLEYAMDHQFGDIHCKIDRETGMKAIIAIHNTKLGPSLGGCRFIEYPSSNAALYDVMRLARGMSYKSAIANLPLGGGKSVILKPKQNYNREGYFHAFGKFVEELNGQYITALDSGTELQDMDIIAKHTNYVASSTAHHGDPAYSTSRGILRGIEAAVAFKLNKSNLQGLHIAIQGLGHVGFLLAGYLHERGAKLTVADLNPERAKAVADEFGASIVSTNDIHKVPCDVFSPCALGAIINDVSIEEFQTTIIAGAANNQLAHTYHGKRIHEKGILYAPDYVINAGGVIFACGKYYHTNEEIVHGQIDNISESLTNIFARSTKENIPTSEIVDIIAQEILAE
ncbi:MAG: amino acid dehydrogenase [Legionellaceae bacterium]|nr:amino acid dehydrogenase [Legionellaceae bacterium]